MKEDFRLFVIVVSLATFMLCALPLVSGYSSEGESGTLLVRGYNLMEYGSWGVVTMIAPLLLPMIVLGCQPKVMQELELIVLLVADMVCYVKCYNIAVAWLRYETDSLLDMHIGTLLYPLGFWVALLLIKGFERTFVRR